MARIATSEDRQAVQAMVDQIGYDRVAEMLNDMAPDEEPGSSCAHEWTCTGSAYGGDDDRWHGEGRMYCSLCGADGDA